MWFRNRLSLLLLATAAAAIVGLVGVVVVTRLVGYRDVQTWFFFAPLIPPVMGLVCAAWMTRDSSGGKTASRVLSTITIVMTWFTGCGTVLSMTALLLFFLFVAAICASDVQ